MRGDCTTEDEPGTASYDMLVQPRESLDLFAVVRQGDELLGLGVNPNVRSGVQSPSLHPLTLSPECPATPAGLGPIIVAPGRHCGGPIVSRRAQIPMLHPPMDARGDRRGGLAGPGPRLSETPCPDPSAVLGSGSAASDLTASLKRLYN